MSNSGSPLLSVTRLIQSIKRLIEPSMGQVEVNGEIANYNPHRSGYLYFTLSDPRSQIQCVMKPYAAQRLNFSPSEGLQVVVRAAVVIYAERGLLQLQVQQMRPDGLGQLFAALERLKARLTAEGLFETARKRPLPFLPRRVGLVTSPQGAVLHDIWTTLRRRNPAVELWLAPAAVQGPEAHEEIVLALNRLLAYRQELDCVIVARGGGSLEDLMPFNHEALVRRLASYPLPVVSAVGHETDTTLCDLVADMRAPTPTAAAELVAPSRSQLLETLSQARLRMRRCLQVRLRQQRADLTHIGQVVLSGYPQRRIQRERERLALGKAMLLSLLPRRLEREQLGLQNLKARMATLIPGRTERERLLLQGLQARVTTLMPRRTEKERLNLQNLKVRLEAFRPDRQLASHKTELGAHRASLQRSLSRRLEQHLGALAGLKTQLQALSPLRVLERGYALCLDEERRPVTRAAGRKAQDRLEVRFFDGSLACRVEDLREDGRESTQL